MNDGNTCACYDEVSSLLLPLNPDNLGFFRHVPTRCVVLHASTPSSSTCCCSIPWSSLPPPVERERTSFDVVPPSASSSFSHSFPPPWLLILVLVIVCHRKGDASQEGEDCFTCSKLKDGKEARSSAPRGPVPTHPAIRRDIKDRQSSSTSTSRRRTGIGPERAGGRGRAE